MGRVSYQVIACMSGAQPPLGGVGQVGGHFPARAPWQLEILEVDVQSALHQWLCLLIAERHCLNVTDVEERAGKVRPRCGGASGNHKKKQVGRECSACPGGAHKEGFG